jgi:hypothetical protein
MNLRFLKIVVKYESILFATYGLFFLSGIVSLFVHLNINTLLFLFLLVNALFIVILKGSNRKVFLFIVFYCGLLVLSICIAVSYGIQLSNSLKSALYYFKPIVFFIIGYYYWSQRKFDLFINYILIFMIIGTFFVFIRPHELVDLLMKRAVVMSAEQYDLKYYIWTFNPVFYNLFSGVWVHDGGLLLRNPTLLFSPLDSGFVLTFISFHYLTKAMHADNKSKYLLWFSISFLLLISTFVRSAFILFFVASFVFVFIRASNTRKLILIIIAFGGCCLFLIKFMDEIRFVFFLEDSAAIHNENLTGAINHFLKYIFGTGVGSSGWLGDLSSPFYIYSEGSFFTSIIENGVQFILIYFIITFAIMRKREYPLLALFLGFITSSLVMAVAFSTCLNLLLFTMMGIIFRNIRIREMVDVCPALMI